MRADGQRCAKPSSGCALRAENPAVRGKQKWAFVRPMMDLACGCNTTGLTFCAEMPYFT